MSNLEREFEVFDGNLPPEPGTVHDYDHGVPGDPDPLPVDDDLINDDSMFVDEDDDDDFDDPDEGGDEE